MIPEVSITFFDVRHPDNKFHASVMCGGYEPCVTSHSLTDTVENLQKCSANTISMLTMSSKIDHSPLIWSQTVGSPKIMAGLKSTLMLM